MIDAAVSKLAVYALRTGLIQENETVWAVNTILDALKLDSYTDPGKEWEELELAPILEELLDDAHARGVLAENSVVYRDLFDTELMGRLTPRPAQVIETFQSLYREDPKRATDWYYKFSQDTNYIRRDRIARDMQWKVSTEHGELDITINLSKPEKDPKAIAAARNLPASNYPRPGEPPRPAEPPHRPHHHQRLPLVHAVLPLCLLQRALHLPEQRPHPHEDRPGLFWEAAGLCGAVPPLLRGLQRRPAHCGRLYPGA